MGGRSLIRDSRLGGRRTACSLGTASALHWTKTSGSPRGFRTRRSEEHTSELQSQSNLVCRLLLEKKKTHALPTLRHALISILTLQNIHLPPSNGTSLPQFHASRRKTALTRVPVVI